MGSLPDPTQDCYRLRNQARKSCHSAPKMMMTPTSAKMITAAHP